MKRFTAILLFHFMLMSAVQPVLAMHFCGEKLHSFSLLQSASNDSDCCGDIATRENKSPLQNQRTDGGTGHSSILADDHASCCDIQLLQPNTDDYQNKTEQLVSRIASFSYEGAAALLIPLFKLSEPETNTLPLIQDFPPKGLFLQDMRLLTYICIYQI